MMDEAEEVSHLVVLILLRISPHGLAVVGVLLFDPELVVPSSPGLLGLTDVLSTFGLDQTINCIVGVIRIRPDHSTIEADSLLSVITNGGDVARRVIGIEQVLQMIHAPQRLQVGQTEGQRIVFVGRIDPLCIAISSASILDK